MSKEEKIKKIEDLNKAIAYLQSIDVPYEHLEEQLHEIEAVEADEEEVKDDAPFLKENTIPGEVEEHFVGDIRYCLDNLGGIKEIRIVRIEK